MFGRAAELEEPFLDILFGLQDLPVVKDIRGIGLLGAVDMAPDGAVGKRGYKALKAFFDEGVLVKMTGDSVILAPPFVATEDEIAEMLQKVRARHLHLRAAASGDLPRGREPLLRGPAAAAADAGRAEALRPALPLSVRHPLAAARPGGRAGMQCSAAGLRLSPPATTSSLWPRLRPRRRAAARELRLRYTGERGVGCLG